MPIFTLIIAYAILGVLFLVIIIGLFWEKSLLMTKAPFVAIPKDILPDITQALEIKPGSVVYDLGCGDGRVLEAFLKAEPLASYFGIDKELVPWLLAEIRLRKFRKTKQIKLIKNNFFKVDLSQATHIFTYLFPQLMDDLLPKLTTELKPGVRLVSCDFLFSQKQPAKVIDLQRPQHSLGRKLYIYEF